MNVYHTLYAILFNRITDALSEMERCNYGNAVEILKEAQKQSEEIYVNAGDKNAETEETTL